MRITDITTTTIGNVCSEDSDNWVMGVHEWHAGYATCSTKKYRHVLANKTKSRYLGKMPIPERIRFAMWTSNDYLPGFTGVGWETAKTLHRGYEKLKDKDAQVSLFSVDFLLIYWHLLPCLYVA